MPSWEVERIVHFDPGDFVKSGLAHFGFHVRSGRYYAIAHQHHYLGLVGPDGRVEWTVAPQPVFKGVPNILAELEFPIYIDVLPDETLVVSNFGNAHLYRIDAETMNAQLLVDGHELGLADMGNCVVDDEGSVWVNEVKGCRVWRFDQTGRPLGRWATATQDSRPNRELRCGEIQLGLRPAPGSRGQHLCHRQQELRAPRHRHRVPQRSHARREQDARLQRRRRT